MTKRLEQELYIGLMSGTSLDGIDAVLVDFSHEQPKTLNSFSTAFSPKLKATLQTLLSPCDNELELSAEAGVQHALESAHCVNQLIEKAKVRHEDIRAIGSHGQTIRHCPNAKYPFSVQIGDPSTLAHHCGINVVADFRMADIAAGGQGAPLVPAFHACCFRHQVIHRFIVNIGGIANITYLPPHMSTELGLTGFDTGPGNTLLDQWIYQIQSKAFDDQGAWARGGECDDDLLKAFLSEPYFSVKAPKSTGRELFNIEWLKTKLGDSEVEYVNIQRTLLELTAVTISQDILTIAQNIEQTCEVYICGGGSKNQFLMERLKSQLNNIPVDTTESLGINPQLVEASAFAWLAKQRLDEAPGNLCSATGAQKPKVLGGLYLS